MIGSEAQGQSNNFETGTGKLGRLPNPANIVAHPLIDNFYFISDKYGIRVLCML